MKTFIVLGLAVGMLLQAGPALAAFYGDVARKTDSGRIVVGGAFNSQKRDVKQTVSVAGLGSASLPEDKQDYTEGLVTLDVGLSPSLAIMGRAGQTTYKVEDADNLEGTPFSVGVRYVLGGDSAIGKGVFVMASRANVTSNELDGTVNQTDVGAAISGQSEQIHFYAGALMSTFKANVDYTSAGLRKAEMDFGLPANSLTAASIDLKESDKFGMFGGLDFSIGNDLVAGAEFHALFESGLAFYAAATF